MRIARQTSFRILSVFAFLLIFMLSACNPLAQIQTSLVVTTETPEVMFEPTQTPTLGPSADLSLPVTIGIPYPQTTGIFGLSEVEPVVELARWGEGNLNDAVLSSDGQILLAGFASGLKQFDVNTLDELPSLMTDPVEVLEIQFSADGRYLALMTDYQVQVYDWNTREMTATIDAEYDQGMNYGPILFNMSFSRDGKMFTAVVNQFVHVMDPATGVENPAVTELQASAAFFSQDDQNLILIESAETSHQIVFLDAQSLEETHRLDLQDYASAAYLSDDHRYLAVCLRRNNEVVIVDLEDRQITSTINQSTYYDSNIYSYTTEELTFSPDSSWLVGRFGGSNQLMVWDVAAGVPIPNGITLTGYGNQFTFNQDGSLLFGFFNESGKDGYSVWNTAKWEWEFSELDVPASEVFFPSEESYLLVENHKTISTFLPDIQKFQNLEDYSYIQLALKKYKDDLPVFDLGTEIYDIVYLDKNTILSLTNNGFQLREAATYDVLHEVKGDFLGFEISNDKKMMAAVLPDESIQLFTLPELNPGRLISGQEGMITRLFLEPEGKTLVSTSDVETVQWDCATGERLMTLENGDEMMFYVFLPGEVIGVTKDFSLAFWDSSTGAQVHTYMGSNVAAEGIMAVNLGGVNTYAVAKEGIYRLEWSAYPSTYPMVEQPFDQVLKVEVSDDEERLAVLTPDGVVVVNLVNNEIVKSIEGVFSSVAFMPGSKDLVAAKGSQLISYSNDLQAAARSTKYFYSEGLSNPQFVGAFSPYAPGGLQEARDVIAMQGPVANGYFYYDSQNGQLVGVGQNDIQYGLEGDQFRTVASAWSADGNSYARLVTNQPNQIYLEVNPPLEVNEDESLPPPARIETQCTELSYLLVKLSNNGRVALECGNYDEGYAIYIYDGSPADLIETIKIGSDMSESLAISADGNRLAFLQKVEDTYQFDFKLLDLSIPGESKEIISSDQGDVTGGNDAIASMAFDQNGELLAIGGTDGSILLLDAITLSKLSILEGHTRVVDGLLFINRNQQLLSSSDDGTVRVWGVGELVE